MNDIICTTQTQMSAIFVYGPTTETVCTKACTATTNMASTAYLTMKQHTTIGYVGTFGFVVAQEVTFTDFDTKT